LTSIGPVTPDHVIRTKPTPAWFEAAAEPSLDADAIRKSCETQLSAYAHAYEAYFERCSKARGRTPIRLDRLPRVLLFPGLGALTVGKTLRDAEVAADVYAHTASVILTAVSSGQYRPVGELDLFDVEYWSLEQQKLRLGKTAAGPLERQIAVVTGAASGIGRATAEHLLSLGAHVVIGDRNGSALEATLAELKTRFGPRVLADVGDVTDDADVKRLIETAVDSFGGLDIVVSNAGTAPSGALHSSEGDARLRESLEVNLLSHQRVARAAVEVLLAQGVGGCLLFNASKSAFGPGPEFGPYAVPKAAVVALMRQYAIDLGAHGIRSNAVNADRIRTELFSGGVLETRARARGVSPDEYFRQNLLHRETTSADVARAFGWLATAEGTTGAVVTVDGGNPAAFPR
jgi:NAD(P)-dependent dehydrogenase (short-subunit alcohol dehydrogenase family)